MHYLKDYRPPHYTLPETRLEFTLDETKTVVRSELAFNKVDTSKPLVLNGRRMVLKEIKMDDQVLAGDEYALTPETLTLNPEKEHFTLSITVEINPSANTELMGLYVSDGILCTQCEPEGFRNITYYPDHSDVPSRFTVTIHADRQKYPVVLSNGNKIQETGDTVVFEDPYNKPCYLFALVAGKLDAIRDTFTTRSGKKVALALYCEPGKKDRLTFAMQALKTAMAWDEKTFGLEYDLDTFSIVAVSHFNAGAMENKSLNIFNDAALLASPDTATDAVYEYIEHVVAHEYFHNYSGDRVTLRDWFNLSLKEGLTVYRDQEFGYDTRSRAVGRIDDVQTLKMFQFPEDDGPLAHPVWPDKYKAIDNFYTVTIYEKGAELIRMQEAILGREAFLKACRLYFKRYDGQAVTIDEFVKAMEDSSGVDLSAFKRWYHIPGRPRVRVETTWDPQKNTLTVSVSQSHKNTDEPFMIPLRFGLLDKTGRDVKTGTLIVTQKEQTFSFDGLSERPVLSINRGFSAPVDLDVSLTDDERLFLMTHDSDLFNRYETGHQYALDRLVQAVRMKGDTPDETVIRALGSYLEGDKKDLAFLARAIVLPGEEEIFDRMEQADIPEIYRVRRLIRQAFATRYRAELEHLYHTCQTPGDYSPDTESAARRAVKNVALGYLSLLPEGAGLAKAQFDAANNLTDRLAALNVLLVHDLPGADEALQAFYDRYRDDDLVLTKWFALQARKPDINVLKQVKALTAHEKFDYKNPNKVRALIGAFGGNLMGFHNADLSGYRFMAEEVLKLDRLNPHLSAKLLTAFSKYKKVNVSRQEDVRRILTDVLDTPGLSANAAETLERLI